jgi:hypothetical protein
VNILDRLSEFQEEEGPMALKKLLQYREESKVLSRIMEKAKKGDSYVTKMKLLSICQEWLHDSGYLLEDALTRLKKLGFKTKPQKIERTEMADLFMNTWRVLQGKRKLPGVQETIELHYDSDGDGRWSDFRAALTSIQLELDIWRLLLTVYGKTRLNELCLTNPSPPMRKKLGIE